MLWCSRYSSADARARNSTAGTQSSSVSAILTAISARAASLWPSCSLSRRRRFATRGLRAWHVQMLTSALLSPCSQPQENVEPMRGREHLPQLRRDRSYPACRKDSLDRLRRWFLEPHLFIGELTESDVSSEIERPTGSDDGNILECTDVCTNLSKALSRCVFWSTTAPASASASGRKSVCTRRARATAATTSVADGRSFFGHLSRVSHSSHIVRAVGPL